MKNHYLLPGASENLLREPNSQSPMLTVPSYGAAFRPRLRPLATVLRGALLLAGACIAVAVSAKAVAASAPRVTIANGVLEGTREASGILSFKGIPFAAAPVGDLRWKAPQPAPNWSGVRNAQQFGARPMQRMLFADIVFRNEKASEDCLFLNVWTPTRPGMGKAKLPVLVYFYGGGFAVGDGSESRYDGESMAREGIVTLTVNYRLNAFGFMAHPELSAESPHKASGNYGLMDQAAALKWVKENIAAFGGDPARVTIAGESAGSFSVSAQMASPLSKDLIAGAIGESGSLLGLREPMPLADAEKRGTQFAAIAGAPTLAALRAMPAEKLLEATAKPDVTSFSATLDGYVLPRSPLAIYQAGEQAKVPLLAGWNSAEGSAKAILAGKAPTPENFGAALSTLYGDKAAEAQKLYGGDVTQAATDLAGDRFIGYSTWKWIHTHAISSGKPTYRYYYAQPRPVTVAGLAAERGASHSAEIEYAMGNLNGNKVFAWTPTDRAVSKTMKAYFANFIKTGNPNGKGLPLWPTVTEAKGAKLMHIDATSRMVVATDVARFEFLEQQMKK